MRFSLNAMDISSDAYTNEPVRYPALKVVDLREEGAKIAESYRNLVINRVNGSCLRLAVFDGDYVWHYHPKSDELFIVVEGCLAIDWTRDPSAPMGEHHYPSEDYPPYPCPRADRELVLRRARSRNGVRGTRFIKR
jgi:hypothetical protein